MTGKQRVGLVLGSGSARGWAHIGVLRALAAEGVVPDLVCGTSVGALVGSIYAEGRLDEFEEWVRALQWRGVLSLMDPGWHGGLLAGDKLVDYLSARFIRGDFAELQVPFAAVATDLSTGREVWLREGKLADAVRASYATPGLFRPVLRDNRFLIDGGVVNPVPVSLARAMGADIVIAVDLGFGTVGRPPAPDEAISKPGWLNRLLPSRNGTGDAPVKPRPPSMVSVVHGAINVMQVRIARSRLAGEPADVLIAPRLAHLALLDYHRGAEAIEEGKAAVSRMLPLLRQTLDG